MSSIIFSNYCRVIASRYNSAFRVIQIGTCMVYFIFFKIRLLLDFINFTFIISFSCLTASLPMFFDILLDYYEKVLLNILCLLPANESHLPLTFSLWNFPVMFDFLNGFFFCPTLVLPSAIFLRYRDDNSMPSMFIALTEMQSTCIALLIWIAGII